MKKLTLACYFGLIVMLLVTLSAPQASARQKRVKQGRSSHSLRKPSSQVRGAQQVRVGEEAARVGRLATGDTTKVTAAETSSLKMVRRNPAQKVTKENRPRGRQPASPRMEYSGGLERAREPVSPREDFRPKQ